MSVPIALPGISAGFPNPGTYIWTNFAAGPAAGTGNVRKAVLLANMITGGTATAGTLYGPDTAVPCNTESDVINLFKAGSEAHRGFLRWTAANKGAAATPLYIVPIVDPGGTAATMAFLLTNVPTSAGVLRIWINDEYVDYSFAANATLLSIVQGMAAAINAKTQWGVTASGAIATVTVTAKQTGPRGNWIQGQAMITAGSGGAMNTTVTNTTKAFFTGGATADSNTTALATIANLDFYYQISAAEDATQFGALASQVESNALPSVGIRNRCIAGSVDTQSNVNAIAIGLNAERAGIIWGGADCDIPPFELACSVMGAVAVLEAPSPPRHNFCLFPVTPTDSALWKVPGPRSRKALSGAQITSALTNGVSPVNCTTQGAAQLVKLITTRSLTSSQAETRIRDWHRVTVTDNFAGELGAKCTLQFGGKDIADDPAPGAPPPFQQGNQITTPGRIKDATLTLVDDFYTRGEFKNVADIKAGTIVQKETNPSNRVSIRVPEQIVDTLDQIAVEIDQVA